MAESETERERGKEIVIDPDAALLAARAAVALCTWERDTVP